MEAGRRKSRTVSTRGEYADLAHRVGRTRSSGRAENTDLPEQMNAPLRKDPAVSEMTPSMRAEGRNHRGVQGKHSSCGGMLQGQRSMRYTLASDSNRHSATANRRPLDLTAALRTSSILRRLRHALRHFASVSCRQKG